MKQLREDFDRWLITATFEEKIQLASLGVMLVVGLLGVTAQLIGRESASEQ